MTSLLDDVSDRDTGTQMTTGTQQYGQHIVVHGKTIRIQIYTAFF